MMMAWFATAAMAMAGAKGADTQSEPPGIVRLSGERVQLVSRSGEVAVREISGRQAVVHATVRAWDRGCAFSSDDSGWRIEGPASADCSVVVLVELPSGMGLDLVLGAGDVSLTGGAAPASLQVGAGDVRIAGMRGALALDLGAGDVEGDALASLDVQVGVGDVAVTGLTGASRVAVGTGGVALGFESLPSGEIDVQVGVGDVLVDLPRGAEVDADVRAGVGSARVDVSTSSSASTRVHVQAAMGRAVVE